MGGADVRWRDDDELDPEAIRREKSPEEEALEKKIVYTFLTVQGIRWAYFLFYFKGLQ
jgi:hypothetical protein